MLKSNVKDRGIPPTGVIIPKSNKTFSVEEDGGMLALYYFDAHNRAMVLHKDQSERVHLFPEVEQYLKENHPEHFIENDEHKINAMDKIGVLVLDFKEILRSRYIKEREYYDYKDEIYNFLKSIKSNLLHISIDHRDIRKQKLLATMNSTIIHWGEKLSTNYDEDDILDIDTLFSLLYEIEACVQSITDNHGAITPEVNEACSENRENVVSIFSIPKK